MGNCWQKIWFENKLQFKCGWLSHFLYLSRVGFLIDYEEFFIEFFMILKLNEVFSKINFDGIIENLNRWLLN